MRRKRKSTMDDTKEKKKKMMNSKTKMPYWERKILRESSERGRKVNRVCEPSKGGMGSRLNTARRIFKKTM